MSNPMALGDKVRWLMMNYRDPFQTLVVDKYAVREYVGEQIGEKHLKKLIGVYDRAEDIDFDSLPQKFVLKTNHGSGWNIICEDKDQLDIEETKQVLDSWMSQNYYHRTKEWAYKNVVRKILCEKYYEDSEGRPLDEYNVFCCFGEPIRFTVLNRWVKPKKYCVMNTEWEIIDDLWKRGYERFDCEKPDNYDELFNIAKKLSADLPYCRIDLYQDGDNVIFGEITLYPGGGQSSSMSKESARKYGAMIDLERVKKEYM